MRNREPAKGPHEPDAGRGIGKGVQEHRFRTRARRPPCRSAASSSRETPSLIALRNGIAFFDPVSAEIIGDVQRLHVGEAQRTQRIIRRLNVWAMAPGATSTIDNNEPVPRQGFDAFAQSLETVLSRSRADVLRTRNMRLRIEHVRANLNHQWFFALGGLEKLG